MKLMIRISKHTETSVYVDGVKKDNPSEDIVSLYKVHEGSAWGDNNEFLFAARMSDMREIIHQAAQILYASDTFGDKK